jgi:RHS repeat-associated protein
MLPATNRSVFRYAFVLAALWSSGALAQTSATRTSSFAYDAGSGLLTQEVVEPNQTSFRLETDYTYDAFGNKLTVQVSGVDIVTRTESVAYDAKGQFRSSATNALSQSESWPSYDARFGAPLSHTGPNGLTTTWTYDNFGRKVNETRADGTQTKWDYLFCSGFNGGTASCVSGAVYLIKATPLASDGATQNGPIGIVYFDLIDREIARDTQGFDASTIRAAIQYDAFARVQKKSRPYFASGGTAQWTTYTYDALSRVTTETFPDNSMRQHAFHGLVTTDTNGRNQARTTTKNSQGQVISAADAASNTTTYKYDPFGNLISTTDPQGNVVTATYDVSGRKTASNDPDLGAWSYGHNTLGQLVSQTDAKGQVTTITYDLLGRQLQRVEPDMTSQWVYDTAAHGIGKVATASITAGVDTGYQRVYSYDNLSRPQQLATTVDGTVYTMAASYDANGRLSTVTYPSGFSATYLYTSLGYAQQLTNTTTGQVYWTANARDAEQHLTQQTAGNGVITSQAFNAQTGRMTSILAGTGGTTYGVQNFTYSYDVLGNLLTRADVNTGLSESFVYDTLNRLTSATVGVNTAKTFGYDSLGNLTSKSDVGAYTYAAAGLRFPHAVMSISGSTINTTFSYDNNGNQTAGLGRTITWTSYNKPSTITQGSRTITFDHEVDHQRFKQMSPEGTTLYFDAFDVHVELFRGTTNTWNEYLSIGNRMIAVRFLHSDETVSTRYFQLDHLGSIAVITDENAAVVERLSYDAWGKRRFPDGTDDPTGSITSQTSRGFTGQEMLADIGLVHLNGRVYDPLVGRMMSVDPYVPDPFDGQSWNAYSYVVNNPLAFTDPNGYCFLGICGVGQAISNFFGNIGNFLKNSAGGIIGAIIASAVCTVSGPAYAICVGAVIGLTSGAIVGVTTGRLDLALRAGLIAGVTAAVTAGVAQGLGGGGTGANVAGEPDDPLLAYASADQGPVQVTVYKLPEVVVTGNLPGSGGIGAGIGGLGGANWGSGWGNLVGGGIGSAVGAGLGAGIGSDSGVGLGPINTAYRPGGDWWSWRPCLFSSMLPGDCFMGGGGGGGRGASAIGAKVPRYITKDVKIETNERITGPDGKMRCEYCGNEVTKEPGRPNSLQYDHGDPWSTGGGRGTDNIFGACRICNLRKSNTPFADWLKKIWQW